MLKLLRIRSIKKRLREIRRWSFCINANQRDNCMQLVGKTPKPRIIMRNPRCTTQPSSQKVVHQASMESREITLYLASSSSFYWLAESRQRNAISSQKCSPAGFKNDAFCPQVRKRPVYFAPAPFLLSKTMYLGEISFPSRCDFWRNGTSELKIKNMQSFGYLLTEGDGVYLWYKPVGIDFYLPRVG